MVYLPSGFSGDGICGSRSLHGSVLSAYSCYDKQSETSYPHVKEIQRVATQGKAGYQHPANVCVVRSTLMWIFCPIKKPGKDVELIIQDISSQRERDEMQELEQYVTIKIIARRMTACP